jgi:phage head maturation protease
MPDGSTIQFRRAPMADAAQPVTFDAEKRTVDVVFSAGAAVDRRDPWTGECWVEVLQISADAVDLSRLNAGAPVLNAHSAYDLGDVIGVVERAWVIDGKGVATIRFSDRDDVAPIVADVRAGILRNISVGYKVQRWDEEERGGVKRRTATRWTPMEISFVPIPADAAAQVRAHSQHAAAGEPNMPELPTQPDPAVAERARITGILQRGAALGIAAAQLQPEIDAGTPLEAATERMFALAAELAPGPIASARIEITRDERATMQQAAEGYVYARLAGTKPTGPAEQFAGAGLADVGRAYLLARGEREARWASPAEILTRNQQSSSDFPRVVGSAGQRYLADVFRSEPPPLLAIARERDVTTMKDVDLVGAEMPAALEKVSEGGPVKYSRLYATGETYRIEELANIQAITSRAWLSDDLGAFALAIRGFGIAAVNSIETMAVALLEANANTLDGTALFHANHNNLLSAPRSMSRPSAARAPRCESRSTRTGHHR